MPPDGAEERSAWVTLAAVPGVGPVQLERMRTHFGSLARTVGSLGRARRLPGPLRVGLTKATEEGVLSACTDPGRTERQMRDLQGWIATPFDHDYQRWLGGIAEPPSLLFGIGSRDALGSARAVAVVGTRRPTAMGRALATRVSGRLSEARACVVSGLAVGIDSAAHIGALDGSGPTVAVVGGGLDAPGPAVNRRLATRIVAEGGAIVSEHRPGVRPSRGTFPRRNRIISALAIGTVVIEAPARSGALITARHALEQGRRLVVAPGRPGDTSTAGCLSLLRESPAVPLVGLDEMVVDLGLADDGEADGPRPSSLSAEDALRMLSPLQRRVAQAVMAGPRPADAIAADLGVEPGSVAAALTLLQLRGWTMIHGSIQIAAGPLTRSARTTS